MKTRLLSIGGLIWRFEFMRALPEEDLPFAPFLIDRGKPDFTIHCLLDPQAQAVSVRLSYPQKQAWVSCPADLPGEVGSLKSWMIRLPVEEMLLQRKRFFLHASLVASPWGGLLFSGNSGSGKSTQAELWRQHMGCPILNGDRALISGECGWLAYGSPYAGSSGYYINDHRPIRAIVFLEKGPCSQIFPLSPAQAFQRLLLQSSVLQEQNSYVAELCDLLEALVSQIPVYLLQCTPDVSAVEVLKAELQKENHHG